jgi:hypothetical protein
LIFLFPLQRKTEGPNDGKDDHDDDLDLENVVFKAKPAATAAKSTK